MKKGKVLGIDYGSKRVGVASGDLEDRIAFPRDLFLNEGVEELTEKVAGLCKELGVVLVVVGLPLNMGEEHLENEIMADVRHFVDILRKVLDGVEVEFFDERLSSFEAEKLMDEAAEASGKEPLSKDAYAAQVILQRFFDRMSL